MMLQQGGYVLCMVLCTRPHPPVPPVGVVLYEIRRELNTMRHRIN